MSPATYLRRVRVAEKGVCAGERRYRKAFTRKDRRHRARGGRDSGGEAGRRVSAVGVPDRLGHADEYEPKRSYREPRQRSCGRESTAPER